MGRLVGTFIQPKLERVYVCAKLKTRFKPRRKENLGKIEGKALKLEKKHVTWRKMYKCLKK